MRITAAVTAELVAHAREEAPNECCGLLLERAGEIVAGVRARNAHASPSRYLVHPEDHFGAIRRARREGLTLAGAYHSHPRSPAQPSATDVAEAHDPELLYVIVALNDGSGWRVPDLRAWRLAKGSARAVLLSITP
ncbi:MAG: M67 family metallopeptidase [Acidobacteria bacterium]|nr:M67 family metallopeptidase [Acidobacteriota bacterium]MBA3887141.1 M67 family metallopeptidase [Acidobacteriota bacterium]